jgi:hypothetical protein
VKLLSLEVLYEKIKHLNLGVKNATLQTTFLIAAAAAS